MFEPLPADLEAALTSAAPRVGRFSAINYSSELDSTNATALTLAAAGAREGTCVLADEQRAGRGRRGRVWHSPPEAGVYLSAIVRPRAAGDTLPLVTLAAGVAMGHATLEVTGLPVELKWPNDLVIGRPWRKLGGVLCEATGRGADIEAIVIGIGVNVRRANYPDDLRMRASSLELEAGRGLDRVAVIVSLLEHLRLQVDRLHAHDHRAICDDWRSFARPSLAGANVRWEHRGVEQSGRAHDIDGDGALLVEHGGRLERVIAGEVQWEGRSHGE